MERARFVRAFFWSFYMFFSNLLRRQTPKRRISAYYFVQAMSVGAVNAFAGIWFASIGITTSQIGFIFAVPVVFMIFVGVLVGRIADRADDWRDVIVTGAILSGLIPLGLIFADHFWSVLLVWTLAVSAQMATLPVIDAATLRMSRRLGFDFGNFYAWKTIGYLSVIVISGAVLARLGPSAFLPLFLGLSLLRGVASVSLPPFREARKADTQITLRGGFRKTVKPWFLLPLIAWSLVHCTHFVLSGFLGLLWREQGFSTVTIGLLIGVSGLAETAMFVAFKRLPKSISARLLILISCLTAILRWLILSTTPEIALLVFAQTLHATTYALGFLACTNFIANWTDDSVAAEAQSLFTVLQFGMAIFALISFGWLAEAFGAAAFIAAAVLAILAGTITGLSLWIRPARPDHRN